MERYTRKVPSDALVSYDTNRYSVPFRYVGQAIQIQDDKNGMLRFFAEGNVIAEHLKSSGRDQTVMNKQHFEGIRTTGHNKVPQPMPRLVSNPVPEVLQRPLSVYEQIADDEVIS